MASAVFQSVGQKRGLILDPRTKLALLLTMAAFGLGGAGGALVDVVLPYILLMPFALLLLAGKWRWALFGAVAYVGSDLFMVYVGPYLSGLLYYIALGSCSIFNRFLPSLLMATYLVSTTTVSEFTAALQRMHVSEKIIIPLSVMFRFFPTVADEAHSISTAMRMRGIRLGGCNAVKAVEYRMVPLMACCVKIGEELSAAALTRGLGGTIKRTNICKIGLKVPDVIALCLCAVPCVLLVMDLVSSGFVGGLL